MDDDVGTDPGPWRAVEASLWRAAEALRGRLDPGTYKHAVLPLVALRALTVSAPDLPAAARWAAIQGPEAGCGARIDAAIDAVEVARPDLAGALSGDRIHRRLPDATLHRLVDALSTLDEAHLHGPARDAIGRIYGWFLGRFALAEGRGGGQFYTPDALVRLLVALVPLGGTLYDPCCGSGGLFVHAARRRPGLRLVGQESNPATWRLARLNLAVHGLDVDLGSGPADTLTDDRHPALRADTILANPPFNQSDWGARPDDPRWAFGPVGEHSANLAWVQHIVHHLAEGGRAGVVMAHGALTSRAAADATVRQGLVRAGHVEAVIDLPDQLFHGTPIPCCVWLLRGRPDPGRGVLMVDARRAGRRVTRARRDLGEADIGAIAAQVHAWRAGSRPGASADVGFGLAAVEVAVDRILGAGGDLAPGPYLAARSDVSVGTEPDGSDLAGLVGRFRAEAAAGARLDAAILDLLDDLAAGGPR